MTEVFNANHFKKGFMTDESIQDLDWCQLVITDKDGLSGSSVASFVSPIIRRLGASAVAISDLDGAVHDLKEYEGCVLSADDFLRKAASATQFDWAFLFLYKKSPKPGEAVSSNEKQTMLQADLTIRLADDMYFYIYGRDKELMNNLRQHYPEAEFKMSKFTSLDIPY
jgi:hypothetical protein